MNSEELTGQEPKLTCLDCCGRYPVKFGSCPDCFAVSRLGARELDENLLEEERQKHVAAVKKLAQELNDTKAKMQELKNQLNGADSAYQTWIRKVYPVVNEVTVTTYLQGGHVERKAAYFTSKDKAKEYTRKFDRNTGIHATLMPPNPYELDEGRFNPYN